MSDIFPETDWSLLRRATTGGRGMALEDLCRAYREPIVRFIRAWSGGARNDEEDLAQGFIADFIRRETAAEASPDRGRFRDLIKASLRNYLLNARRKDKAVTRGGNVDMVSWDAGLESADSALPGSKTEPLHQMDPDKLMDVAWAQTLWRSVILRLRSEWNSEHPEAPFEQLQDWFEGDLPDDSYETRASSLGLSRDQFKRRLRTLRDRHVVMLHEEVGRTVPAGQVQEELRYLQELLAFV